MSGAIQSLDGRPRRKWLRRGAVGLLSFTALTAGAWFAFPLPMDLLRAYPSSTVLTDRDGLPLRVRLGPEDVYCRPLASLPKDAWVTRALLAVEDARFYSHPGVDPMAMARAALQNVRNGRVISGASTISTQVIRLIEPRPRTLRTKFIEVFRAFQLEAALSKDEILLNYLNRAPFGSNLIGVESASRRYFGKDSTELSLAEAALLAGLPQSPSRLSPIQHLDRALQRQRLVLDRMAACGMITQGQRASAAAETMVIRSETYPFLAPHFCLEALGETNAADEPGAIHRTTLDGRLQRCAENALERQAEMLRAQHIRGGAVVLVDVKSAAVRALAGSPDFSCNTDAGQVNGATARRSAGSTLKPFLYALAADQGRLTPLQRLMDVPRDWRGFEPGNFSGSYLGPIPARTALALSLNLPALHLAEQTGPDRFLSCLRDLGLRTLDRPAEAYGLALALGGAEVRLTDLADAYAALARGGRYVPSRKLEQAPSKEPRRVFSEEAAWLVTEMLGGDERRAEALGHCADTAGPRAAWKTGTSAGGRDAWCVVWNPDWVIAVWTGNPDGSPSTALTGVHAAAPIAWDVLRELYPDNRGPWFAKPAGIESRSVCAVSGAVPGPYCGHTVPDWAIRRVSSCEPCRIHRLETVCDAGGLPVQRVVEHWPARVEAFLRRRDGVNPPVHSATDAIASAQAATGTMPDIRSTPLIRQPVTGATYKITGQPSEKLWLRAYDEGTPLCWFLDNRILGWSAPGEPVSWPLQRGVHTVVCSDSHGRSSTARFMVE